ncbi:hypothetical protein AB0383_44960 [Amycolatopsis sp. NPDC051373]|uniref:hypothetical protein n=1 Tax=Amycolatopsis sp. NPDC051373 TaxID=3155801 RepID=UPI00344B6CFD
MTATVMSKTSWSELLAGMLRVHRSYSRHTELIAELQTARLTPACIVKGIEHQNAEAIVRAGLPTVEYRRRTLHRHLDEHLFVDTTADAGVRVLACWDTRASRMRMHVAEVGAPGLWDRIVIHFTEWEKAGRPVPGPTRYSGTRG